MGSDQAALTRLWQEKRGERAPEDLSDNLLVHLGHATEPLNRQWYERNSGTRVVRVQEHLRHAEHAWMGATLDGLIENSGAVFEAKFMLPWSFSEEAAIEKHMAQLQHNMLVAAATSSVLSIITGGGKWIELKIDADAIYQAVMLATEEEFWDSVQTGNPPQLLGAQAPIPRIAAMRVIDMTASNAWAEFGAIYARTRVAHGEHEAAKSELKRLIPNDAKEAFGHGVRAKRSRNGAVSFDLMESV
jgi:predicted phage-related endonuclease